MRQGSWIQNFSGDLAYRSFRPSTLPPVLDIDAEMTALVGDGRGSLAQLETASQLIPNYALFLTMYVRKEALISSQLEGTQCTLDDVLDPSLAPNEDITDVVNYVRALQYAVERFQTLPLCNRLIKEVHSELMRCVRGQEKSPGEFRRSQNWIGHANCSLREARYVPPNVEDMNVAMGELEQYINENEIYDPLIRAALIHYQFETIHPFLDGNGRIGRMLIILYLIQQKLLSSPILYVSYFLKKNQIEYYDRMSEVRKNGNYEQWIRFFLLSITESANDAIESANRLSELHSRHNQMVTLKKRTAERQSSFLRYLEQHPITTTQNVAEAFSLSYNTASRLIRQFMNLGILVETTNRMRSRVYSYSDYLDILRKDT